MPAITWQLVTNSELMIAGGEILSAQPIPLKTGQQLDEVNMNTNNVFIYGLASVTPYPTISLKQPRQISVVPVVPVTTLFVMTGDGNIWAAEPSPANPALKLAFTVQPQHPNQNGLAVYQQAIPAGAAYIGPPLPIYLYVLCTVNNGEKVFRYQMNSNPPYQPAGLNANNAADPTFLAAGAVAGAPNHTLNTSILFQGLACSADGLLAVADGGAIRLFDAMKGIYMGAMGVNAVSLGNWNPPGAITNGVFSLAFGPDGCLYVMAGPPANPGDTVPSAIAILKVPAALLAKGVGAAQLLVDVMSLPANDTSVGMTIGGTPAAPIVFAIGVNANDEPTIVAFDGNTGNPVIPPPPQPNIGQLDTQPWTLALVDTYTLKETIQLPPKPL